MTHLDVENLASDYLEGRLEVTSKADVEVHLEACAACRERIADLRSLLELCRSAEKFEPAPWLVSKILGATTGQRKRGLRDQLAALFRPVAQPRVAYALAMAVFSLSIIVNAARINLRHFTLEDLNPRTWLYRASRAGYRFYAHAEKFYYDLRVVYEIQSRFRGLGSEPQQQEQEEAPSPQSQPGGSTDRTDPRDSQLASVLSFSRAGTGRSPTP